MTKDKIDIPIEVIRHWFVYEPDTGLIRWRVKPKGTPRNAGDVAGNRDKQRGYIQIRLLGKKVYGHRMAWALHYGEWPQNEVDHINLNRSDNRIANLRAVTHQQNMLNLPKKASQVGLTGVYRTKSGFMAQTNFSGRRYYIGHYKTAAEAKEAYNAKLVELRGEFAVVETTSVDPAGDQDDRDIEREPF